MRRPRREREGIYIPDESEGVYLPEDLSKKVGLTDTTKTSNAGATGTSQKTTGSGTTSTTDKPSADAFSTNKGG